MGKVLIIGGSPSIGKSTIAHAIGTQKNLAVISTDDVSEVFQISRNYDMMKGKDYINYYKDLSIDALIKDIEIFHHMLQPCIKRLIEIHSDWSSPAVVEGWALYPKDMKCWSKSCVNRVWLIAKDDTVLRSRLLKKTAFHKNDTLLIENYLKRSLWHNKLLLNQCLFFKEPYIMVNGNEDINTLLKIIFNSIN